MDIAVTMNTSPMKSAIDVPLPSRGRCAGVTVLELMVSVTLISFIILSLYEMFDFTQAQMRRAVSQVDQLEAGRAALDLISRDVSQLTAPATFANPPLDRTIFITNYYGANALIMTNDSGQGIFTNTLHAVYFNVFDIGRSRSNWTAVGYHVAGEGGLAQVSVNGLGTLYRFEASSAEYSPFLFSYFANPFSNSNLFQRVANNIVHFRMKVVANSVVIPFNGFPTTNMPSHVEMELGYLEDRTAEVVRGMGSLAAARQFISLHPEKVQLFRLQIPIRSGL